MKLKPDVTQWKLFVTSHARLCAGIAVCVIVVSAAAGGFAVYRHRAGADYAFQKLHQALRLADSAVLARMIDFSALSEELVQAVLAVYPHAAENDARRAEMRDEAQRLALAALDFARAGGGGGGHGEGGHGGSGKESTPPPRKISDPIPFLPEDAVSQIAAGLKMEKSPAGIVLRAHYTNNVLQRTFPVEMGMERRRNGWVVTRLFNARELVALFKEGSEALRAEDKARLEEKNAKITAEMREYFDLPSCSVSAGLIANKLEALMLIKVAAVNTGKEILRNVNLLCKVSGAGGQLVFEKQLNAAQRVFPGEKFDNSWWVSMDADSAETGRLLGAQPLSCAVELKSVTLGHGRILYPVTE